MVTGLLPVAGPYDVVLRTFLRDFSSSRSVCFAILFGRGRAFADFCDRAS